MSSHSHGDDGRRGLPRQGSVYGLTLTEVETQLGEPLRTMNLDDLLRTVLPAAAASPRRSRRRWARCGATSRAPGAEAASPPWAR